MSLKLLALADLHLGKSSSGVPDHHESLSTKYTWNRIIEWAVNKQVDILLLCGDIIDRDNRYFEAIGPLESGFQKLDQHDVQVYLVTGNHDHDVLAQIVRSRKFQHVHLLGADGKWEIEKISKNHLTIQIAGWSFPSQYVNHDPLLSLGSIDPDPNFFTIGLLHGDLGSHESRYAPITLNNLLHAGINLWVLGHIHKPWEVRSIEPVIWYPGSPHAMSAKEQGMHGPLLIDVVSATQINVSPVALSPVRYENIFIDITDAGTEEMVRQKVITSLTNEAEQQLHELENVFYLIYDVVLEGFHEQAKEVPLWMSSMPEDYVQQLTSGTKIRVRQISTDLRLPVKNLEAMATQETAVGILASTILALDHGESTDYLEELIRQWQGRLEMLNNNSTYQRLRPEGKLISPDKNEARKYILKECRALLQELIDQQSS